MAARQPGSIPTPRRYPRNGRPRSRRFTSWGRGRLCTDGPSSATCSVSALRRPRLRAPARAPDLAEFTDKPSRPQRLGGRSRPLSAHPEASPPCDCLARAGAAHLAAWSWSTIACAPLHGAPWERGPGTDVVPTARPGEPRRAVRRLRLDPRPIRPAGDGGCVADLRTTVYPVHVPIPRCKRASDGLCGPTALTLVHPQCRFIKDPSTFLARTAAPRTAPRLSIGRSPADHDRLRTLPTIHRLSRSSSNASMHILGTPLARTGARSFAGASPRMVDVRRERARQHRPRPCHR